MAEGYIMTIPKSVLNQLTLADEKINQIAKTSENAEKRVVAAFRNMANGVDPFLKQLDALKSLGKINIDTSLKSSATSAEKTANSIAKVAVQLNKVAESPIDGVNRKISSMSQLIEQATHASERMQKNLSQINSGSGSISRNVIAEGVAGKSMITEAQSIIKVLELERAELQQNSRYWKEYVDTLNGSSIAAQKQKAEMDRLNESFRSGQSKLQQTAKAEDDFAKAVGKVAVALEKAASAKKKSDEKESAKDKKENARLLEKYDNALAKSEKTLTQRINKIRALAKVEKELAASGRDYSSQLSKIASETQRLKKANEDVANSMQKVKKSHSSVLSISDQLARKLGLLFSVSAMQGYVNKLVAVRGEFELQNRALQSILQNKEKADEIWDKTVQLAVRSPFTVKELVTYTKQLAAYRIEADKLYDTNKMLADVSAGLGVSMDRLILAFGQVKAANYLRASEVRQFTEAGVNILGELSSIYEELEGRMVSVAEVQERITKRMVTFGDVEEVFKRITSAGGIFYNTQEVQAETLAGMMSNLQDTFDLMFNEIGKANEGVLKGFVTLLKDIVNNWEKIAQIVIPIIMTLVGRFLLLKTAQLALAGGALNKMFKITLGGFQMMGAQLTHNIRLTNVLRQRMKMLGTTSLGGWAAALSTIVVIGWEIYNALHAAAKEQDKMNKTILEGVGRASEMSKRFKVLADIATDAAKSTSEQKEALAELKRAYGDVVSEEDLRIENLKKMKGNYDAVTNAIYAKIEASTRDKLMSQVQDKEGEDVIDALNDLYVNLKKYGISAETSRQITNELRKSFESGLIKTPEDGIRKIEELVSTFTNLDSTIYIAGVGYTRFGQLVGRRTQNVIDKLKLLSDKVEEINGLKIEPLIVGDLPAAKKIDSMFKSISTSIDAWKKENENKLSPFELSENTKKETIKQYENFISLIKEALKGEGELKIDDRTFIVANKYIEKAQNAIKEINGTPAHQEIEKMVVAAYKLKNADLNNALKIYPNSSEGLEEYVKKVKNRLDFLTKEITIFNKNALLSPFGSDPKVLEEMIKEKDAIIHMLENDLPNFGKESGTSGESEADKRLKKQLSLLKEIGKAYEDNLKYYNKEDALAKTKKDYASAAKEAGIEKLVLETDLDPAGLISALEKLSKTASSKVKLDIERAIGDIKGQLDLDVKIKDVEGIKKQLDDLFAGYELSVEMDKLGLDESLINQLFNVDTFSIDDIKKKLSQIFPDVSKLSKEQLKVYEDTNKKIANLEKKALESRLKDYTAYLKKSVSERVRIEMEGQKKIADIPAEFRPDQRNEIANNIKKETQKKLDQQDWADFQNSDLYIKLFEDLDNVSTKTLNTLRQKLLDLKQSLKDLPASELRAITSQIKKVEDELSERNPFKGLGRTIKDYISSLKDLRRLENERTKSLTRENELEDQVKTQERYYNLKEQEYNNAVKTYGVNSQQAKEAEKRLKDSYSILSSTKSELALQKGVTSEIEDQQDAAQKLRKKLEEAANAFGKRMGEVNDLLSDIQSAFGGMMSDSANEMLSSAQEIISGTIKTAEGLGQMASGDWIGGGLKALGGLASTIGSVFDIGDKKKERQIQDEIKLVGRLQKAYEKLEQAIDDAYTIDTLNRSYENAEQNLKAQNESLQRMIAAEESKKKTDKDKIEEWQNQIEENNQKRLELESQKIADLGGFGSGASMASAAEEFASAWIDAFRETGDGLSALEDKWDEYINNVIVKQLALRGMTKFLEPIMGLIDDAIKDDSYLSTEELNKIKEEVKKTVPEMNDFFKSIMDGFGEMIPSTNDSDLTGMQKGVQSVTEEQAGVIEAYLNSIRFFVADSNLQLQSLALLISRDPAQNPIYSELMAQTRLLRSIDDRLSSVITAAGNHQLGGFAIKSII